MNWTNVSLILKREIRDQLRDRRTLFMIFVLPVLLYPLLGVSMVQLGQLAREEPAQVLLIGREHLPAEPELIRGSGQVWSFAAVDPEVDASLLELRFPEKKADSPDELQTQLAAAQERLRDGDVHAVLYFPPDFGQSLDSFRSQVTKGQAVKELTVPSPEIFHNTAKRKSAITYSRLRRVLDLWREALVRQNLKAAGLPELTISPFRAETRDVAGEGLQFASAWSAVFPFMMLIWALTGAFYPAIDLCAGEKERGTLETLLSSPAERSEIVAGKLGTVMLFSIATVILNLIAIGGTGWFVISQLPPSPIRALGPPPMLAFLWVFLAMIPVSALFSALCMAMAAFARSNKEGQYYLMPLFLVTMPLVVMPLQPNFELSLGTSLVPLTGIVLLLKAAIEGSYVEALRYFLPVTVVTVLCCLLALRWAIDQFNKESVMFRESERFVMLLWLRHLVRDRRATPTVAGAVMCGVLILAVKFFLEFALVGRAIHPTLMQMLPQIACVLPLTIFMTLLLARSPRKTLRITWPRWWTLPAAIGLAIVMHPVSIHVGAMIQQLYPMAPGVKKAVESAISVVPDPLALFLIIAILAPVCEELAFRGFILSGLRHLGRRWMAIVLSSIFFGVTHGVVQQSLLTALMGTLIAFVAVQTGSLIPAVLYHIAHNGLMLAMHFSLQWAASPASGPLSEIKPWVIALFGTPDQPGWLYHWGIAAVCAILAALLVRSFARLPYEPSEEEELQTALSNQGALAGSTTLRGA